MYTIRILSLLTLMSFFTSVNSLAQLLDTDELAELLSHADRMELDNVRDLDRKPIEVMKFAEVGKGKTVLDIYAGGGWYSELFSLAVGPQGKVYAHNDPLTWRFGQKEMQARTADNRLTNLTRIEPIEIQDIVLPNESVDIAFMGINYHDLYFISRVRHGKTESMRSEYVDYRKAFNAVKKMLKPNGILVVTDHRAIAGSGYQAANELHRIDPDIVKYELEEVGFTLVEQAFYLQNPKDDLTRSVFTPELRGKTDRFIFKFALANLSSFP